MNASISIFTLYLHFPSSLPISIHLPISYYSYLPTNLSTQPYIHYIYYIYPSTHHPSVCPPPTHLHIHPPVSTIYSFCDLRQILLFPKL